MKLFEEYVKSIEDENGKLRLDLENDDESQ